MSKVQFQGWDMLGLALGCFFSGALVGAVIF